MSSEQQSDLPPHVQTTVRAIANLHAAHEDSATPVEQLVDRLTSVVARPVFVALIVVAGIAWIGGNLLLRALAGWSLDKPPFPWLQGAGELAALVITTLVLVSQRRKDALSELREQLTLQLAIIAEQKSAKIVALIEEMRRDNPMMMNRVDAQADEMSNAADPEAVLGAFKDAQETGSIVEDDVGPLTDRPPE